MDERWNESGIDIASTLSDAAKSAIKATHIFDGHDNAKIEISCVLTNDEKIRALNKEYRNKDKPTNVLSFPQVDFENPEFSENGPIILGDIILAFETVNREAAEQEKTFLDHFTHLIVHGTLHLLGFDHETDAEAEEMEALEVDILDKFGIENPYSITNFMA